MVATTAFFQNIQNVKPLFISVPLPAITDDFGGEVVRNWSWKPKSGH
jgi:hypothetical protein